MRYKSSIIWLAAAVMAMFASISIAREAPEGLVSDGLLPAIADKAVTMKALLGNHYSAKQLEDGVYVGSEFCIACHQSHSTWRDTKHSQALRRPLAQYSLVDGQGVVADYDQNGVDDFQQGLDFNQISSVFDRYKPNAPILAANGDDYTITIGELTLPIVSTQGGTGDWKQRYLVRIPVVSGRPSGFSKDNYVSPLQFNEVTKAYVGYHPEFWWDQDTNLPLFNSTTAATDAADMGRSYSKRCIGCHTTGIDSIGQDSNGEWNYRPFPAVLFEADDPSYFDYDHDGIADIVNIGCEACHGPGSEHILGGGDPSKIVNPADLAPEQANEVCGQCHSRTASVPNGTHGFPYQDDTGTQFIPGQGVPLSDFYTDASGRWPDGINSTKHHQQYFDFLESPKPGFQYHPVVCNECHEPHGQTTNKRLIRDELVEDGITLQVKVDDDSFCLSCHATHGEFADISVEMVANIDDPQTRLQIGAVVSEHSNHPFAPERMMGLSRCVDCHMPKIAKSAIAYDIRSHTFEAIPPTKTLGTQDDGGMPSSCAVSCHSDKVNSFGLGLDPSITIWDGAFDVDTAEELQEYYGPDGLWWQTHEEEGK